MRIPNRLWNDQNGLVSSKELLVVLSIVLAGVAIGAVSLNNHAAKQSPSLRIVSKAASAYGYPGITSRTAQTAGSGFVDRPDSAGVSVSNPPEPGGGGDDGGGDNGGGDNGGGPLTQGYWKNHPEDWPTDSLTLGDQTYSQQELIELLKTPAQGDASIILAYQLIAAKLNVANGVNGSSVSGTIATADGLLSGGGPIPQGITPSSPAGQSMVEAGAQLDAFNNGHSPK